MILLLESGDEFIILLPNTNKENAKKVVDRINQAFSDSCVVAISVASPLVWILRSVRTNP